jgi:nuclear transport factor 2 (NTF2) superfamily protein
VKSGLKAPSTFRAIQVIKRDERVTWEQHLREEPNDRNVEIFKRAYELGKFRRIVTLEYEASNAFGVPIRSTENCAFDLRDGNVADRTSLENSVKIAEVQRDFRQLNAAGALPNGTKLDLKDPPYSCCE